MTSYSDVCQRWVDNCLGGHQQREIKTERLYPRGDRIFSYGSHFEMARALRDKNSGFRCFLVNGDRYSVTTSGHQSRLRSAIGPRQSVLLPYSALEAAGIVRDTIEIVDVLPDRVERKRHTFTEMQPGWQWRDDPVYAWRDKTTEELQWIVDRRNARGRDDWEWKCRRALKEQTENQVRVAAGQEPRHSVWSRYLPGGSEGTWTGKTIADLDLWERNQVRYVTHTERHLYRSRTRYADEVTVDYDENDTPLAYWYDTTRHWLGESLIRAQVPYRVSMKCKSCGATGRIPWAGDGPPEWWTPDEREHVWTSEALLRQERRRADTEGHCRRCSWGSGRTPKTYRRTALFLSGFDHNETRDLYFFSELPDTKPTTVEEAYEALKPDTVKMAEQMGREVSRQGDIFAVPMLDLDKRRLRKMGAAFEKRGTLLGTNHVATEVARLKDGQTLARGTLTHAPEFRRPDHRRVTLPKGTWCLVAKNTVPVSA